MSVSTPTRSVPPELMAPPRSAYVHIPFCRRRCYYCDFPISVVGDRRRGETSGTMAQYVAYLCQEIKSTPALGVPLTTVFLGGGTPSLLSVAQLTTILEVIDQQFGIARDAEISMEMDPGTFDLSHVRGYRQGGINRISLGVQAFQSELLQACGRTHSVADIDLAFDLLHQAATPNISLDLISGLPYQTLEIWADSLAQAIALQPHHISVYDLTVEPQTAFGKWYQAGQAPLPADELTVDMYRLAQDTLTASGYHHYEISNYAQPGYRCRHNLTYWKNQPYYGFGMGATSYVHNQRFSRPRTIQAYGEWVEQYKMHWGAIACETTPIVETLLDQVMVGLRLADGISLELIGERYGKTGRDRLLKSLYAFENKGWIIFDSDTIRLSDPEGFLFSNVVLTAVFEQLSEVNIEHF
ncbi:MAG: radical SAM family heme chaperone HemW [Cyanobacteria bacterium J06639_16]